LRYSNAHGNHHQHNIQGTSGDDIIGGAGNDNVDGQTGVDQVCGDASVDAVQGGMVPIAHMGVPQTIQSMVHQWMIEYTAQLETKGCLAMSQEM
jgi:hypothetical protein